MTEEEVIMGEEGGDRGEEEVTGKEEVMGR